MKELSVLSKAKKENIVLDPFPYIVISNAIEDSLYKKLSQEYPSQEDILNFSRNNGLTKPHHPLPIKENTRHQISAIKGLSDSTLSPLWKNFLRYHTSSEFYLEVVSLFGEAIKTVHPHLEGNFKKDLKDFRPGLRFKENETADIVLDCQPGINTPLTKASSVRGPHIDNPVELFAGLLYMRMDEDNSEGGDLEIYTYKDPWKVHPPYFHGKAELKHEYVEKVKTIPYAKNTLVFFINSLQSVHGVSVRNPAPFPRRLVNMIGESYHQGGLFTYKKKESFLSRAKTCTRQILNFF